MGNWWLESLGAGNTGALLGGGQEGLMGWQAGWEGYWLLGLTGCRMFQKFG